MERRKPLVARKGLTRKTELAPRKAKAESMPKRRPARRDTIPARVRAQVAERDGGKCVLCPEQGAHQHHRRIKGIGGDTRPHTECACNIVTLCLECHEAVHGSPAEAMAAGYIVTRQELFPGSVAVLIGAGASSGATLYPTCDGLWSSKAPEGVAA